MSGIINAVLVVGVLFAGVWAFQHKDELLSQLNGIMGSGGGGGGAAAAPIADAGAPDTGGADVGGDAPATAAAAPTDKKGKKGKDKMSSDATDMATGGGVDTDMTSTTTPTDKKTSDKTGSTKKKTSKPKCKKGEKYDSKKKKCVKDKKKKSHYAFAYYTADPNYYTAAYYNYARVMRNFSFVDVGASPRVSL